MQNMQNDQSAQDARKLLVALSTNHPEARRASPFVGMDRPFSPSWADAEQAGLDRVRRDAVVNRQQYAGARGGGREPARQREGTSGLRLRLRLCVQDH